MAARSLQGGNQFVDIIAGLEPVGSGQLSRAATRCKRSLPVRRRRIVHMSMA